MIALILIIFVTALACVIVLAVTRPKPVPPLTKPAVSKAPRIISASRPMALSREDLVRALARELLVAMRDEAAQRN